MQTILHRTPPGQRQLADKPQQNRHCGRRELFGLVLAGSTVLVLPGEARTEPVNKEVDAAVSPYIQELLRRTEENKERRYKERLNDYYKRNFRDYFEFESGDPRTGRARGVNPETQAAIRRWLDNNK